MPLFSFARNAATDSGFCARERRAASIPRRHVVIAAKINAASSSGIHPPSTIFSRLAPKNARSISRNTPLTSNATPIGQRHTSRMALNSSAVVSSMVVETAVPYAPARLSELPKL